MRREPVVLVTGFMPFDGMASNPSWETALAVQWHWATRGGADVVARRLPVDFEAAPREMLAALGDTNPDAVVCLGVAAGRPEMCVERVAINCMDAGIPDAAGRQPEGEWIDPRARPAYFSTLPLRDIAGVWQEAGIPGRISNTAGTYVCNRVMFDLLRHADEYGVQQAGFIHVPATPACRSRVEETMSQDRIDAAAKHAMRQILGRLETGAS